MTAAIDRLTAEGWQPEGTPDFGFVFINRNGIRRRLILTERDPPGIPLLPASRAVRASLPSSNLRLIAAAHRRAASNSG
jgi:hypothetical protein